MKDIKLHPGDIFCTRSKSFLGKSIRFVTKIKSADNQVDYNHVGIVLSYLGETLESLNTIKRQNLFTDYSGIKVLVGRHKEMTPESFEAGQKAILKFEGNIYPYWRFIFHLLPWGGSKYLNSGKFPMCSELADIFLFNSGVIDKFKGRNPDQIADMIHRWKGFQTIHEGVLS